MSRNPLNERQEFAAVQRTATPTLCWLWAIPAGKTDRLDERPLTSMALTPEQADRVEVHAARDGWHSFRRVADDNATPDFAGAVRCVTDTARAAR